MRERTEHFFRVKPERETRGGGGHSGGASQDSELGGEEQREEAKETEEVSGEKRESMVLIEILEICC